MFYDVNDSIIINILTDNEFSRDFRADIRYLPIVARILDAYNRIPWIRWISSWFYHTGIVFFCCQDFIEILFFQTI